MGDSTNWEKKQSLKGDVWFATNMAEEGTQSTGVPNNLAAMEAQLGQMASQLQEREAVNNTLTGELAMIRDRGAQSQDLARQVKELHSEIERVMSKSQYETGRLQSEVNSLTEQLSLKRAESDKLSSLVQSLQAENNRLTQKAPPKPALIPRGIYDWYFPDLR
ncbi:hypothetical protein J6590_028785 [Homalodisca vitripennis]|nr:hypothetical protein J6590_028785 [Homalodisca vitripennis]